MLRNSIYLCGVNYEFLLKIYKMNYLTVFLSMPGGSEWIIIGIAILLLFGGKKIPELMKGLGSGVKEFKNAAKEDKPADKKEEETKE